MIHIASKQVHTLAQIANASGFKLKRLNGWDASIHRAVLPFLAAKDSLPTTTPTIWAQ
jgi:hypothetical protein